MQLSMQVYRTLFPKAPIEFVDEMNKYWDAYGINTIPLMAAFLGQTAGETGAYTAFEEKMGYKASTLATTGPWSVFHGNPTLSAKYANNPQALANYIYSSEAPGAAKKGLGNGNEASGDGWKYRGCGLIQVTGKYNYKALADMKGMDIDSFGTYAKTFAGVVESAFMFWKLKKINSYSPDFYAMTKRVNAKQPHMEIKLKIYQSALSVLAGGPCTFSYKVPWETRSRTYATKNYLPGGSLPPSPNVTTTYARDSDTSRGGTTKSGKRIRLETSLYRDMFSCKCGCGRDTVDAMLVYMVQGFIDKIKRPVEVTLGTTCINYKDIEGCVDASTHIFGKAAHIKVPPFSEKSLGAMTSTEIMDIFNSLYKEQVYCVDLKQGLVHVDASNF